MSELKDEFYALLDAMSDSLEQFLFTRSAIDYAEYSKVCGQLEGLSSAKSAYETAENEVGEGQ